MVTVLRSRLYRKPILLLLVRFFRFLPASAASRLNPYNQIYRPASDSPSRFSPLPLFSSRLSLSVSPRRWQERWRLPGPGLDGGAHLPPPPPFLPPRLLRTSVPPSPSSLSLSLPPEVAAGAR
ncbi:hypothetical protein BDA96_09G139100 [Sorghum bicolor]|uniref:Uncharacterized protein n=1 Tax=Sorghum bicolor TaxID=4558 RepID=A0A921QBM6_SORBI|nr:hypothetical protein BDA96_09G139100 [Sorghum bicolor]